MVLPFCPVTFAKWCPWCYEGLTGRASHSGHQGKGGRRAPREIDMASFVRPSGSSGASEADGVSAAAQEFGVEYPALWEHLSLRSWDDGSPRETSTLSVFLGAQGLQAALNDRDGGRVAFVTAVSLQGLLGALEAGIRSDTLDWRRSYQAGKGKRKK
jgi:hypothetical protein